MEAGSREEIFLGLGSNLGNRLENLRTAIRLLAGSGLKVLARSSVYETPPWGKLDQAPFYNMVLQVGFGGGPEALLDLCLAVEKQMGRLRTEKWGPRIIDIDILVFGENVLSGPELEIPHPQMLNRLFVLVPLAEIAPRLKIQGQNQNVKMILSQFDDYELNNIIKLNLNTEENVIKLPDEPTD